jgi:maltose/moltooligosaccharide transporter
MSVRSELPVSGVPRLEAWQIWNMSFGFLGIQFGWGLQMANMSAIYEYLGARPDQLSKLWLAAPLTGLIVQPIIGAMSDRTWGRLGRRRPYFLTGALLSSAALILMPNSSELWMAAGLLWILDASINISMEPFRAFVADLLPEDQRTSGFAMQSLFIGLGAVIASALPWLMSNVFGVSRTAGGAHAIPMSVRISFYVGAAAFLGAVLWTIVSTREHPPDDLEAFRRQQRESRGLVRGAGEIFAAIGAMPATMKDLAWVQMCTWFGLFCMWLYFPVAVARSVFGAPDERSPLYTAGIEWAGLCFGLYSAVCFAFSFVLPRLAARLGRRQAHGLCLLMGALGLLSVAVIHDKWLLFLSMTGVGIAWASILSMPYAMLAGALPPARTGVYMGIFNFFIVIPEIVVALTFDDVMMPYVFRYSRVAAVIAGGILMLVAAVLAQRVREHAGVPEVALKEAV